MSGDWLYQLYVCVCASKQAMLVFHISYFKTQIYGVIFEILRLISRNFARTCNLKY